jgi:hypothetical protein
MGKSAAHIEPRLLDQATAAAYCGLSPEGFRSWQSRGIVPDPIPL